MFSSHIFDTKEIEKEESNNSKQQSITHMQKFSGQFERGFPPTPIPYLEALSIAYQKIHLHDPNKVQSCRTSQYLKSIREIPKLFKRAPDRISKELTCVGIPEFTSQELSCLLTQRNRLRSLDEWTDSKVNNQPNQKHRKSFSNASYFRQLGRANELEQARLFPHAKTSKIHTERTRDLETEFSQVGEKLNNQNTAISWCLYPSS